MLQDEHREENIQQVSNMYGTTHSVFSLRR